MTRSTTKLRKLAFHRQQGCCYYCGMPMWLISPDEITSNCSFTAGQANVLQCTAEHLLARCDGGRNTATNIAAACRYCNHGRHARKRALAPADYGNLVRARILQHKWHSAALLACLPPPRFPVCVELPAVSAVSKVPPAYPHR